MSIFYNNKLDPFGTNSLFANINKTNQQINSMNLPVQPTPEEQDYKRQRYGNMMLALSDVLRGKDPSAGVMQRQAIIEAQKKEAERKAEQDKLIASMSPEQQQIYKAFGPNAAFQYQQQQLAAELSGLQELKKIQGLKNAGFSDREINLFTNAGMKADDILALRDQNVGQSLDEIKNSVDLERSTQDEVTGKAPADDLANLNEAHGSILPGGDAFQENVINWIGRSIGLEPADETGAAVRAKTELDERILQITTQNYSGRPSVFLLEQIKKLIPPVNTSDKDAFESYSKIETRVRGYLQDLEREIQSGQFKGEKLELMKSDFRELYGLQQDLETAKKGLGDFQADIKPNLDNQSSGNYDNIYLNDTK